MSKTVTMNITIDEEIWKNYKAYCISNSLSMSGKVREFIEDFMKNKVLTISKEGVQKIEQDEVTVSTEGKPQEGMSSMGIAMAEVAEKIIEPEPKKEVPIKKPVRKRIFG
jgi:hypothetical protein